MTANVKKYLGIAAVVVIVLFVVYRVSAVKKIVIPTGA